MALGGACFPTPWGVALDGEIQQALDLRDAVAHRGAIEDVDSRNVLLALIL
jgi:hypothetical protein